MTQFTHLCYLPGACRQLSAWQVPGKKITQSTHGVTDKFQSAVGDGCDRNMAVVMEVAKGSLINESGSHNSEVSELSSFLFGESDNLVRIIYRQPKVQ